MDRIYTEKLELIEKIVRQEWDSFFPEMCVPKKFVFKKETGFRKTIVFIHHNETTDLLAIAHIITNPRVESRLKNHYAIL